MAKLGNYCKAYLIKDIRKWERWPPKDLPSGTEILSGDSVVFLQEDYKLTRTMFRDEQVLHDEVSPDWVAFCRDRLGFEVPTWIQEAKKDDSSASNK